MTLRQQLIEKLAINYRKAPKTMRNQNNLELTWNPTKKIYIGIDEKGEEWIAALQTCPVPMFYVKCPNVTSDVTCNKLNIVTIIDGKKICHSCAKEFVVKLDIPKSSKAYEILENLDK